MHDICRINNNKCRQRRGIIHYSYLNCEMEPTAAQFGHLFSWRHPTMDLSHAAAYRYNQNMMEYYTCKSKFVMLIYIFFEVILINFKVFRINVQKLWFRLS